MPEENAESQKPAKYEMKERHYTITPEERHNIVADFVSDILNSYRSIDWYGISQDWQKKFSDDQRLRYNLRGGACANGLGSSASLVQASIHVEVASGA